MIPNYIANLIAQGEGQKLDFKFRVDDASKIAISLVAFANTDGGTLLIGVKDNGNIAGISGDEEYYMIESAAEKYAKPAINFTAKMWKATNKNILEITVEPSPNKPHFAIDKEGNQQAYQRVNDENHLVNRIVVKLWQSDNKKKNILKFTENEAKLLQYLKENKKISTAQFLKVINLPRYKAENLLILLLRWGILNWQNNNGIIYYTLGSPNKNTLPEGFKFD